MTTHTSTTNIGTHTHRTNAFYLSSFIESSEGFKSTPLLLSNSHYVQRYEHPILVLPVLFDPEPGAMVGVVSPSKPTVVVLIEHKGLELLW